MKSDLRNWDDEHNVGAVLNERYMEESVRYDSRAWGRGGPTAMGRKAIELVSVTLWIKGHPFSVPPPLFLNGIDVEHQVLFRWYK